MSSSMTAAIHLGPSYLTNSEIYKNTNFEEIESLFKITQKLILEHSEDISECENDWQCISILDEISIFSWSSDQMGEGADSVLCLGLKTLQKQ